MNEYNGHWITTYTGKKFHYLDPQRDEVDIRDIAHALALTCRFGGHCGGYYSVAEHSIRVANIVRQGVKLHALLHDAGEAYCPDIPRPIKYDYPVMKELDESISQSVMTILGVRSYDFPEIREADSTLLATEARDLMHNTNDWGELPPPLKEHIKPMGWYEAEVGFLNYYEMLKSMSYVRQVL